MANACTDDLYAASPLVDPNDPQCFLQCKAAILNGMATSGCETSTCTRYCKPLKCPTDTVGKGNGSQSDSDFGSSGFGSSGSQFGSLNGVMASYPLPVSPVEQWVGLNVANGFVHQVEADYQGHSVFPLVFRRYYNSAAQMQAGLLGKQWRSSYDRTIIFKENGANGNQYTITAYRPDGKAIVFDDNLQAAASR